MQIVTFFHHALDVVVDRKRLWLVKIFFERTINFNSPGKDFKGFNDEEMVSDWGYDNSSIRNKLRKRIPLSVPDAPPGQPSALPCVQA